MPFCHVHLRGPRPLARCYPQVRATIGDHLRKRRLDLGLLQREVAETITNWELNQTKPALQFLPGIIGLLGFDPTPPSASHGERLKAARRRAGLSQERFAELLGIDPGTLSRWERNLRMPIRRHLRIAEVFGERLARTDPLPFNHPTAEDQRR